MNIDKKYARSILREYNKKSKRVYFLLIFLVITECFAFAIDARRKDEPTKENTAQEEAAVENTETTTFNSTEDATSQPTNNKITPEQERIATDFYSNSVIIGDSIVAGYDIYADDGCEICL